MLLFLMGVDLQTIILLFVLLLLFGLVAFKILRKILRRTMKSASELRINFLSRIFALILSSIIVLGAFAIIIYVLIGTIPRESPEEVIKGHYQMMEEDFAEELTIGMSKSEVVQAFGQHDTTQAVMTYDLTLPGAREKYILEIKFDSKGLVSYRRLQ
jgi:hypothetical protein